MTTTTETQAIESLRCGVCGAQTIGRQWYNQDSGFGLCEQSAIWLRSKNETADDMSRRYGVAGIHYDISEISPACPHYAGTYYGYCHQCEREVEN